MPRRTRPWVTGLVLAAGGSKRLGRPKQLLPYGSATLLGHVLGIAGECEFDQLLCVVGGGAHDVLEGVEFSGVEVVENPEFGEGCSSSIAAALRAVDPRAEVLVLMLGDQPGVAASSVAALVSHLGDARVAACEYSDGRGHPLAFARGAFRSSIRGRVGIFTARWVDPGFAGRLLRAGRFAEHLAAELWIVA